MVETSQGSTSGPLRRARMTTSQPSSRKRWAVAAPIPLVPPVTTTRLPARPFIAYLPFSPPRERRLHRTLRVCILTRVDTRPFIGVVSDTHGHYDPLLDDLFAGAERIVHAGDIGVGILDRLRRLAPVTAVLGNTDLADVWPGVKSEAVAEALGLRILVGHIRDGLLRFRDPVAEASTS